MPQLAPAAPGGIGHTSGPTASLGDGNATTVWYRGFAASQWRRLLSARSEGTMEQNQWQTADDGHLRAEMMQNLCAPSKNTAPYLSSLKATRGGLGGEGCTSNTVELALHPFIALLMRDVVTQVS